VIAWADVSAAHTDWDADPNKGPANPKRFPVIGAYDGHLAGVGRVVVDATWHHWFDTNLIGCSVDLIDSEPMDATNPKTKGFRVSNQGLQALARIQNYYRNVAIWLGPVDRKHCMWWKVLWNNITRYPAAERLSPALPIWHLGEVALDVLGRQASGPTARRELLLHQDFLRPPLELGSAVLQAGLVDEVAPEDQRERDRHRDK
jgi:hypothetical protein